MSDLVLVLGGARSGKSSVAERLARAAAKPVVYAATAMAVDAEMSTRIARHQARRPRDWRTIELPTNLEQQLPLQVRAEETVLLDCLSVWLSNEILALAAPPAAGTASEPLLRDSDLLIEDRVLSRLEQLLDWVIFRDGLTVMVSNEVGSGVVPPYPLGRLFRDVAGRANQAVAARARGVYLVVAGIALDLRRLGVATDANGRLIDR